MTDRLNMRISTADKERLRCAAKAENRSLSNFIVTAALGRAELALSGSEASGRQDVNDPTGADSSGRVALDKE